MIQDLWFFDFLSLLIVRLSLFYYYFKEALKQNKEDKYFLSLFLITSSIFLSLGFYTSSIFLSLGFYTSFVSFFLLFYEFFNLTKKFLEKNDLTLEIFKISLILVLIFIGPGKISLDRFLNVRF
jgi:uncharacterized membrane protein YphA (DoxX/SURF4 family)